MLDPSRVLTTAKAVGLDALVLVGGTGTLRAALAVGEAALATDSTNCRVLAVPVSVHTHLTVPRLHVQLARYVCCIAF